MKQRLLNSRRGAVMVVVIVCVMLASLAAASLMKMAVAQRRMIETQHWQLQAAWLAEAGLERAAARLDADAQYTGETWDLPAAEMPALHGAAVKIEVAAAPRRPNRRLVHVRADYPDHPRHRARHTKRAVVQLTQ